jgi:small subunit ribosomal protein S20
MRQGERRRNHNRAQRSELRSAMKKVRGASTSEEARAALHTAQRLLDRAARKGLIAKNTASRTKQRLDRFVAVKEGKSS